MTGPAYTLFKLLDRNDTNPSAGLHGVALSRVGSAAASGA